MEQVFLLWLSHTATAHTPHTVVAANVKQIVLVEVSKTVNFGFFVLEMNEGRNCLRIDL